MKEIINSLGREISVILSVFIFAALAYLFPYKRSPETSIYVITEADKKELHRWKAKAGPLMILLLAAIIYVFTYVFYWFSRIGNSDHEAVFYLIVPVIGYMMPALCFGFGIISPVMNQIEIMHFKERHAFMQHVYNSQFNWNAERISSWITRICFTFSFILYVLLVNYHIKLNNEHIYYKHLLKFRTDVYSYEDVKSINWIIRNNQLDHFEISFRDASVWTSGFGLNSDNDQKLLEFISEKSKVPIDTVAKNE